jgi:hypothetical protein
MTDIVERLRKLAATANGVPIFTEAADEIERLRIENWQLKGALGYPVPGDVPEGNFKCGLCEAKTIGIIKAEAEIERLRRVLQEIADMRYDNTSASSIARAALTTRD